ncbi:pyridoxamine 5'-phosphate oxidase family protein [Solihabitans fulvus]|uniref:Pyridoxamine 5'-phosphate oxidase family protein n=1 Tax=Solihabitans fulvus TaxID=1892852 RepID=A0A5B2XDN1_9PSEU|nr:pyridoxamine 5'-phosphate oxidase family protein [Solihabitans fulvus]KAA2261858.1 pyridoxamine 5'-phosphate oxidase family protein [Solihabitans fulvus]
MFDSAGLRVLDERECLRLLSTVPIGRIVFTEQAMPAVQPVTFAVVGRSVVLRAGQGSKLAAATRNAVVAFEADEFDHRARSGWSVVAIGRAQLVLDEDEQAELARLDLHSWTPGTGDHFVRIAIELVNGRRIANGSERVDVDGDAPGE